MPLPRLQLVELEDLPWFPKLLRDYATDYLQTMDARLSLHAHMAPLLRTLIETTGARHLLDLCSGGGGPLPALLKTFKADGLELTATLTDRFPNLEAFVRLAARDPAHLQFSAQPVDATAVPPALTGIRTLFNAFHHFPPAQAQAVLRDAVAAGQPIALFEVSERSLTMLAKIFLTPLFALLATLFIRPLRLSRLLLTYVVPLVPFVCTWDGLVSQCRAYTLPELEAMTQGLEAFKWTSGRKPLLGGLIHLTYVLGSPKEKSLLR